MRQLSYLKHVHRLVGVLLPFYLFTFLPLNANAQVVISNEQVIEEEDDEIGDDEDEIVVTDENGDEEVIEFPEAMTYDLDSLLNLYMSKNYLEEDNGCRMKDENPIFTDEEYIDRLSRLPYIMEMSYNDVVKSCIERYSGRLRKSVSYMLGASNFYMPIFEEALETYDVPLELKYLPIIESALNPRAVSRVGATGLWQFMLSTGKQYGLKINSLVDERRDPIKASYAAANLLSDLYKVYGDWNLVIAAYNCGPGNINKAIARSGGKRDYWEIYPYLPAETRGYVPAFIAANYIMNYYCDHNICPMRSRLPERTDTVMVHKNLHLQQIAAVCGIDIEELRTLNPSYRRDIVPGANEPSAIRMSQADVTKFLEMEDSVYRYRADELLTRRAVVEINDDVPTFTHHKKIRHGRHARYSKHGKKYKRNRHAVSSKKRGKRGAASVSKKKGRHGGTVKKSKRGKRNAGGGKKRGGRRRR
ncbi:MAG: lytic transglycosylase domain-containing protein [Prevotella sp.]|nr:lytic transglycosylase domain-containing protein [Prevotella sp.]